MSIFDEIATELIASELATEVMYYQPAQGSRVVRGILVRISDDERRATSVYARLFVSMSDFSDVPRPARGDEVVVDGELYRVFEVLLESGGAWLALRKD